MALTWIDHWAKSMWTVQRDLKSIPNTMGIQQAALKYAHWAINEPHVVKALAYAMATGNMSVEAAHSVQALIAAPFLSCRNPERNIALQLSRELTEDFWQSAPPDIDYAPLLSRYETIYLDIPPNTVMVDKYWYIRAIARCAIALEVQSNCNFLVFIVEKTGKKQLVDQQTEFMVRESGPLPSEYFRFTYKDYETAGMFRPKLDLPPEETAPVMLNTEILRKQGLDLLKLAMLYHDSVDVQTSLLPQVKQTKEKMGNPKKEAAKLHNATLFACRYLAPPIDRFGQSAEDLKEDRGEHQIGVRYKVRGHFYNQAVGKGWTEHRLRFRKGHFRGPEDAPMKSELTILK